MNRRHRLAVAALLAAALLIGAALVAFAANACPADAPQQPCPGAALNRGVVIGLAAAGTAAAVAGFAFLAEFAARRRIVYQGAWRRAGRRGLLTGLVVAVLAGLRLGDALSVPVLVFVLLLPVAVELALRSQQVP